MTFRTIIGLEVHVQLLTRTKLFCGCSTKFGLPPNSATCPVCAGLPGALPVMNRQAFELALKAALALNCQIAAFTRWDRKNYFYPDLPKNYQISQYDLPFSKAGWLELPAQGGAPRRIGIIRAHLEEDAGKMLHDEQGGRRDSLVDLNRAGTPLLEIVTRPDLRTPEEAKAFLDEIRLLLRELGVSDCEMQEGSLRCDANVNIHLRQESGNRSQESEFSYAATPIVEIKNLNSFRNVERALRYEAERQLQEFQAKFGMQWQVDESRSGRPSVLQAGTIVRPVLEVSNGRLVPIAKATAGWNDRRGVTEIQRRKEDIADYRYHPEPDLVPVTTDAASLEEIGRGLGEPPAALRTRLQSQYGLSHYDAGVLTQQGRAFVAYFEETANQCNDAKEACNWTTNEVLQIINDRALSISEFPIAARVLAGLILEVKALGLNKQRAREVYGRMLAHGESAKVAIAALGFSVLADEAQLLELVRRAIAANPKAVADYKKGKLKAADAVKGMVMRETKGMANTELVQKLLARELG